MLNRGLMSLAHNALRPVVAVIGTTGVGKSQLAVHLAKSLQDAQLPVSKGLVLSADSMQLYKGLDVITNKVTTEEMEGIEHWGLNLISPENEGSWVVGKWCSEAAAKVCFALRHGPLLTWSRSRGRPKRFYRSYAVEHTTLSSTFSSHLVISPWKWPRRNPTYCDGDRLILARRWMVCHLHRGDY